MSIFVAVFCRCRLQPTGLVVWILFGCVQFTFLTGCVSRSFPSQSVLRSEVDFAGPAPISACMAIQGNGTNFASHMGTLIALFERSIDPKIIIGGSSGSIVGSVGRALMNNSSILETDVTIAGKSLSYPQRAALVLGASEDVMNSFAFLPGLDEIASGDLFRYIYGFARNRQQGQLPASADVKILNIEPTVGTAVLITAFFQDHDFSKFLKSTANRLENPSETLFLQDYLMRKAYIRSSFFEYAQIDADKPWTLAEAARLMSEKINKETHLDDWERLKELMSLFQEDLNFMRNENHFKMAVKEHQKNIVLRGLVSVLYNLVSHGLLFMDWLNKLNSGSPQATEVESRTLEKQIYTTFGDRILNGQFFVPNSKLIWKAYEGLVHNLMDKNNSFKFFPIPKGMVIHSTFRVGWLGRQRMPQAPGPSVENSQSTGGGQASFFFTELEGTENLYQGYIAGGTEFEQLKLRRDAVWREWMGADGASNDSSRMEFKAMPFLAYTRDSLLQAQKSLASMRGETDGTFALQGDDSENSDSGWFAHLPPDQIVLFDQEEADENGYEANRGLNFAIRVSAAEPGAFRRYPIKWTKRDKERNTLSLNSNDKQIIKIPDLLLDAGSADAEYRVTGFGGWAESVPLSAIVNFNECAGAQLFVRSGREAPGNQFQYGAVLAAVNGYSFKGWTWSLNPRQIAHETLQAAQEHFLTLNAAAEFSRGLSGKPWVLNDMNFDAPCELDNRSGCSAEEIKSVNDLLVPLPWGMSRLPQAIVGYQKTLQSIESMIDTSEERFSREESATVRSFGQDISGEQQQIYLKPDAGQIEKWLTKVRKGESVQDFVFRDPASASP
jgi:hypothetical protein